MKCFCSVFSNVFTDETRSLHFAKKEIFHNIDVLILNKKLHENLHDSVSDAVSVRKSEAVNDMFTFFGSGCFQLHQIAYRDARNLVLHCREERKDSTSGILSGR